MKHILLSLLLAVQCLQAAAPTGTLITSYPLKTSALSTNDRMLIVDTETTPWSTKLAPFRSVPTAIGDGQGLTRWFDMISPNTRGPLSVMLAAGVTDQYWIFQRLGNSPDFVRWAVAVDGTMGTDLYNLDHMNIERKAEWIAIWRPDTTWSGTWLYGSSSSYSRSTVYQYSRELDMTDNTVTFDVPVTEAGELWLSYMARPDAGYFYVWIDGGTTLADALPTSAGLRYVDAYLATYAFKSVKAASRLKPGIYTVVLKRSRTERNASNTTDYRFYPDAWAVVNPQRGIPGTVGERLITAYAQSLLCSTNSTTNVHTATIADPAGPDVTLLSTDYLYVGHDSIHESMEVAFTVPSLNPATLTAQYWDGVNWTNLTIVDGTSGFTTDGTISWMPPSDWVGTRLYYATGNAYRYWMRIQPGSDTTAMQVLRVLTAAQLTHRHEYLNYAGMSGGQYEYAYYFDPTGAGAAQAVGGKVHGGERALTRELTVDDTVRTLSLGGDAAVGDVIQIRQTMNVTNATAGTVGTGYLTHTVDPNGMVVGWQHTFSAAGAITNYFYTGMLPVFYWMSGTATNVFQYDRVAMQNIWATPTNINLSIQTNQSYLGKLKAEEVLAYGSQHPYVVMMAQDNGRTVNYEWNYASPNYTFWFFNDLLGELGVSTMRCKAYFTALMNGNTNTIPVAIGDTIGATVRYKVARVPKLGNVQF